MKLKIACILLWLLGKALYSQNVSIPIEGLSSGEHFYYQHSFYKTIGQSNFSFFNLTSLKASYEKKKGNNSYLVRNQLFYKIHKNWNLGLTGELTSKGKVARLGAQYLFKNKAIVVSVYSNITVSNKASFVNMLYFKYTPRINNEFNFYSRLQIQTTTYFNNNTKYSNLYRLGVEYKSLKFGIGIPWFDPFNTKNLDTKHIGLFVGATL